jgi:hypothetical protein
LKTAIPQTLDEAPLLGAKPRVAAVCGALGSYDAERLRTMAALLAPDMRLVHEAPGAALMLDRDGESWGEGDLRGIAWPSALRPAASPKSWKDAARSWNSPGIEFTPARNTLHTSVSGVSPVYIQAEDEATYFCSSIDPLARSTPGLLSVDIQAWAAAFMLAFPIDGRTPFEEIRCLGPWSTVEHPVGGRSLVETHTWPWSEIEPTLGAEEGAKEVAEQLRAVFARLAGHEIHVPTSAGRDSRLLLSLAADCGASSLDAYTVYEDTGTDVVLEMAAACCEVLGVRHHVVENTAEQFWDDIRTRNLITDYQHIVSPWLTPPLYRALKGKTGIGLDGIAGNVLFEPTAREVPRRVVEEDSGVWRGILWRKMRTSSTRMAFRREEAAAIGQIGREQFFSICDRFEGHPSRAAMSFYLTRTLRAIALRPTTSLGSVCEMVSPLVEDPVAEALLRVSPSEKFDRRLYAEVFQLVEPRMGDLPFSSLGAGFVRHERPRRRASEAALRGYREVLGSGPLRRHLSGQLRGWLSREDLEPPHVHGTMGGMEKIVTFHLWFERYAEKLREFNFGDALGTPRRHGRGA